MGKNCEWIDLLDPTENDLRRAWPSDLHPQAVETLLEPHTHEDEPRPLIQSHGKYAFAVLLLPVVVAEEDRVYYREIDILMTHERVLTVRKTPPDGTAIDLSEVQASCAGGAPAGMVVYHILDDVAEGFLDMVDDVHDEVDELEDNIDAWDNDKIRRRLSDLRHDLLHIRRTLAPTRDAVRRVIDNRIELEDEELFPHDIELHFGDAYDKLLRASEGLETARDLIGGVRDYHQSKVANDQNEVMKRLTLVASIFLPPTFIVGVYGQNFAYMP
ncbi:MAG: magnesium transporter, partial [Acidimicrobiaceae bacterium]